MRCAFFLTILGDVGKVFAVNFSRHSSEVMVMGQVTNFFSALIDVVFGIRASIAVTLVFIFGGHAGIDVLDVFYDVFTSRIAYLLFSEV